MYTDPLPDPSSGEQGRSPGAEGRYSPASEEGSHLAVEGGSQAVEGGRPPGGTGLWCRRGVAPSVLSPP